jgi:hypothetical protein
MKIREQAHGKQMWSYGWMERNNEKREVREANEEPCLPANPHPPALKIE